MPIYEYYCESCHTVFSFFSSTAGTTARPACPRCGKEELPKRPSVFAMLKHQSDEEPSPLDGLDDRRFEGAMDALMREMGDLDENADPRQMGTFFRRFSELSGLEMGPRMEEALQRLESGEDPDEIESEFEELGDEDSLEDLFQLKKAVRGRKRKPPQIDDNLYFLEPCG